jgi:acetolactate synthase-1/3 small subunit
MRHIISALVENKPGVLAHIAGLFSARGFNIESLAVGETESPRLSRLTLVSTGDDEVIEQIRKQLGKVIDVVKVMDLTGSDVIERDLALIRIHCPPPKRTELFDLIGVFRGAVVDVGAREITAQMIGPEAKIQAFLEVLAPYGIREMVRTGRIAIRRSETRS